MKKLLIFILCLCLLMPVIASCAKGGDNADTSADVTEAWGPSLGTESQPAAETEFVPDDLDENIDFNDEKITFLFWSDVQNHEFDIEAITGDLIDDAIYERNRAVEERLGVSLEWVGAKGNYENQSIFISAAQNDVLAGGTGLDIFAGYSQTAATLTLKGCTQNLLALDYINLEKPWWPDSLTDQSTISGKLYFCSGDISCNLLYMMYCVYFDKGLINSLGLENPYDIVDGNRWTVDKLIEICKGVYRDLNGNNTPDDSDFYGMVTSNVFCDSFFWGSGLTEIGKDSSGSLIISDRWNSEKTLSLLNKICPFFHDSGDARITTTTSMYTSFNSGNALFALTEAQYGMKRFSSSDIDYGVIPVPKYDDTQENFITLLSFPYSMYSVSSATSKADAAAAVLECDASESYRKVTPAVFEISFKYKYSSGNNDVAMWDTIRSGVSFDLGRIFVTSLNNLSSTMFRNTVVNNTAASWTSQFKGYSKIIEKCINNIQNTINSLN